MDAAVKKYAGISDLNQNGIQGWVIGQATIDALKKAGPHGTRQAVLKALRSTNAFACGGIEIQPINLTTSESGGAADSLTPLTVVHGISGTTARRT